MKDGLRVFDADTHVEPTAEVIDQYVDPGFRSRLRVAADERQAALEAATRSAGVDLHQIRTDEDLVRSLVRISALRRSRRR